MTVTTDRDQLREVARRAYEMIGNLEMEIGHPMETDFTQLHADLWKALASKTAIDPATVEACGNCADLQATIDRVRLALDFIEPRNESERNAAIDADLTAGMSLRKTAEKHGTTFGIVRGRARALGKDQ